jgi:hypothetical protein
VDNDLPQAVQPAVARRSLHLAERRHLVGAGVIGAGLALLAQQRAAATTDTTTTAPPDRPTADDTALLAFAQTVELAATDLYRSAVDAGADTAEGLFAQLAENHQAAAQSISGLIGAGAPQVANAGLVTALGGGFASSDTSAVAVAAYDLEQAAVATHTEVVGTLAGTDGSKLVASIIVTEARHAAVLADVAGLGDDLAALLDNDAEALSPDDFPLEG